MPRHLISDAHEWINETPTVPIYYLAKPQPRERAWHGMATALASVGKEDPVVPGYSLVRREHMGGVV